MYFPFFQLKERGKICNTHLNETLSFEQDTIIFEFEVKGFFFCLLAEIFMQQAASNFYYFLTKAVLVNSFFTRSSGDVGVFSINIQGEQNCEKNPIFDHTKTEAFNTCLVCLESKCAWQFLRKRQNRNFTIET